MVNWSEQQNVLYLSIVATQHKTRQRRVLIISKARRREGAKARNLADSLCTATAVISGFKRKYINSTAHVSRLSFRFLSFKVAGLRNKFEILKNVSSKFKESLNPL